MLHHKACRWLKTWGGWGFTAFLVPVIVSFATSYFTLEMRAANSQRENNINSFIRYSHTFTWVSANYVQDILQRNKSNQKAQKELADNLINQFQSIDRVVKYLPKSDVQLVEEYKTDIMRMRTNIDHENTVGTLKPFWENASNLLVLRNRIVAALQA